MALNARDAAARGARIMTRARVTGAVRTADQWTVTVEQDGEIHEIRARALVNAGRPLGRARC